MPNFSYKISVLLTGLLLVLCALSYAPQFSAETTGMAGGTLNKYIYIVTITLLVISFSLKEVVSSRFIITYLLWILAVALMGMFLYVIDYGGKYFGEIMDIGLPICVVIIVFCYIINERDLILISVIYSIALLFVSIQLIFTNIGGFVIVEQYLIGSKNGLGTMLMVSFTACLGFSFSEQIEKPLKTILIVIAAVELFCCLTMRARGATLFMGVVGFLIVLRIRKENRYLYNKFLYGIILTLLIAIIYAVIEGYIDNIYNYIVGALGLEDNDDITNGRTERNLAAIRVLLQSPFFGSMALPCHIEWTHNYLLLKLSSYGIIGAFPLLCLYFYILKIVIKKLALRGYDIEDKIGYWAVLSLFFSSLLEPTPPFTPGTTVVYAYILFAYSLRNSWN